MAQDFPTRDIFSLGLSSGDPGAAALLSSRGATGAQSSIQKFGAALMQLLKGHQSLGTRPFEEQAISGAEQQVSRVQAEATPGFSPTQQSAIRGAEVSAIQPAITGARERAQTFSEQIKSFGGVLDQAQNIQKWLQESEQTKMDNARELIFKLPGAVKKLSPEEQNALEAAAGLDKGLIGLMPEPDPDLRSGVVDVGGRKLLVNMDTGATIKDLGASTTGIGKPPTAAQHEVAGYATRLVQSGKIFDELEADISAMSAIELFVQRRAPFFIKSETVKKMEQAERNFLNAVLRRESGAAISEGEFESGRQQYFAQPGDTAAVLAQKKANRELVQRNFIKESGTAFEGDLRDQVISRGYDYDKLKADGHSDEEIREAVGL